MAAIGGESIGTAYVRIIADGDGLPDSVRDQMRKGEPEIRRAGGRAGKQYMSGFDAESNRQGSTSVARLAKSLRIGSGRAEALLKGLGGDMWDEIGQGLTRRVGDSRVAEKMVSELKGDFRRGADWGDVLGTLEQDLVGLTERAEHKVSAEVRREAADRQRTTEREARSREAEFAQLYRNMDAAAERSARAQAGLDADRRSRRRRDNASELRDFERLFKGLDAAVPSERAHTGLAKLIHDIDVLGDGVGRTFGRTSRNNFLNFFGGLVGGSVKVLSLVPRVTKSLFDLGGGVKSVLGGLKSGQSLGEALGESGAGLASLGATATAGAVGVAALVVILPVLISILTLLGGVVVALAGSITFGLVAGLAAVAGAVLPVALGLGVLVAGIASLDDKAKKALKTSVRPLVDEFKHLGDIGANQIFKAMPDQIDQVTKALKRTSLDPFTRRVGDAISDTIGHIARSVDSPGFRHFINQLDDEKGIPHQIRLLGRIMTNTFGGLGGLFIGLRPITNDFLAWLQEVTQEFQTFTNSAAGQTAIVAFLDRAGESARSLGHLIDNVGELLGELLTAGQDSGDTIIDDMADAVQRLTDYFNDNPHAVQDFFGDVTDFARSVGHAIVQISRLIDTLDSPESRKAATFLFEVIAESVANTAYVFGKLEATTEAVFHRISQAARGLAVVTVEALALLLDAVGGAASGLNKLLPNKFEIDTDGLTAARQDLHDLADSLAKSPGLHDKIKIDVDSTDLKKADEYAHTTDESLRILLGLPPIKPKVDKKPIIEGITETQQLIGRMNEARNANPIVIKANKTQADNAKLATLLAKRELLEFYGVSTKGITLRINSQSARVARGILADLNSLLRNLPLFRTITITTKTRGSSPGGTGTTPSARGGLFVDGIKQKERWNSGGILRSQTQLWPGGPFAGEAGTELIVPLDKPLGQVDASVRELSAIARGLAGAGPGGAKIITIAPTIVTPTKDPVAVTHEVTNELAVVGY